MRLAISFPLVLVIAISLWRGLIARLLLAMVSPPFPFSIRFPAVRLVDGQLGICLGRRVCLIR